ncbi:cysteine desulfurase family protein [Sneathiella limimaris]|uniref:cysteine desulfurase family protein n=1 Tax=Sneathiella limimaris TaxID=1964213 RepID=UPI001469E590|nr:cysteine desulfurase family protein [Sneathiella limimaris]
MNSGIYLDYNATAPIRPEVISLVTKVMAEGGNPSSVHARGRKARARVETARRQLASLVDCKPQEIIFTSGGTEANNMVFAGFPDRQIFVSAGEHDSVLAPGTVAGAVQIPLTSCGTLDLGALEDLLKSADGPPLVSVMMANNETGVLQPIPEIAALVHEHGGFLHTDAIQALGKIPVSFTEAGVDLMTVSSHKIGGPQGQGALILREGLPIKARQIGGGQELGRRSGTENVAGIAGFGLAAELALNDLEGASEIAALRDRLESRLLEYCPEINIYGKGTDRLPNTSCLSMPGVGSELQVMNFDLAGIAVSAGSACSSGKVKASHVLTAMGADEDAAGEAIRISLGRSTSPEEIDKFIEVWQKLYKKKSPRSAA